MTPEPKRGAPVDAAKPAGPKWGDPGHPLPAHGDAPKPSGRAMGQKPANDNTGGICLGDVVTLKSGGPSMCVIGLDSAVITPGSPATDPEVTPERKAAGQTDIAAPFSLATVLCQWFTPNGECKEQRFQVSALTVTDAHAKPWAPAPVK